MNNIEKLQQTYSRQNWQTWLQDFFGSQINFEIQVEIIEVELKRSVNTLFSTPDFDTFIFVIL